MNPKGPDRPYSRAVVDHPEVGAWEDRPGQVEFLEEACSGVVAGVAGGAEDANAEDAVGGLRDDVGVGLEDRRRCLRGRCVLPCACAMTGIMRVSAR